MRWLLFATLICWITSNAYASFQLNEEGPSTATLKEAKAELNRLIVSQKIGLVEATPLLRILEAPLPDRARLFIPSPSGIGRNESASVETVRSLMQPLLERLAEETFQKATKQLDANNHEGAFRLHFQTLAYNANHPGAKAILEPWLDAASRRVVQAKAEKSLTDLDWKAGSYAAVATPHFAVYSRAPTKPTVHLADLCEQAYCAWQQLFYRYWCDEESALVPFRRKDDVRASGGRFTPFRIVLFRNQEEYVKTLSIIEPNIKVSTGYYSPKLKTAFFYWDEREPSRTITTLRHELAHQFFNESGSVTVKLDADNQSGVWGVEGIALYFESLTVVSDWTMDAIEVGGWDSPRLQASRFRRLHDETWIPWEAFHAETGSRLRGREDIAIWYTQAAGLAHYMMDRDIPSRNRFMEYLEGLYRGNPKSDILDGAKDDNAFRANYDRFLQSPFPLVKKRLPTPDRPDVVVTRLKLDSEDFLAWPADGRKLKWLDLSFTQVDDSLFLKDPSKPWEAIRLSLEGTKVTDASMASIAKMPKLEELDLSGCIISDEGIQKLKGNVRLKYLWLTGTKITEHSYDLLRTLRSLELLEVSNTGISQESIKKLRKALPKWKSP